MADVEVKAFPNSLIGMLLGALLAGIGLFLVGQPLADSATRIVGFILFLAGVIIFAL